ncbi:Protein pih1d3 [Gonapodya sp. JEL0774]|nr:Protein pih1d3 [Gonapodya sp. JEL0774]
MNSFETLEALRNLLVPEEAASNPKPPSRRAANPNAHLSPASIGPPSSPASRSSTSSKKSKRDIRQDMSIWDDDEIEDVVDAVKDEVLLDPRERPTYDIRYRQNVDSADVFLGMSGKANSSMHADEMVVEVDLPAVQAVKELEIEVQDTLVDIRSQKYRLHLPLPKPVDDKSAKARWDTGKHVLSISLRIKPEF